MAVLVVLFGVVVALLGLLVAGLLRSHAEILRALHQLGVDMDPARPDGVDTPLAAPTLRSGTEPAVRSGEVPKRPSREAVDIVGVDVDHASISIAVSGRPGLTLLAFLSSGCGTCHFFWDAFAEPQLEVPGGARLVAVTKGADAEQPAMVRKLAPTTVPVVMSTAAWDAYDVPVAPFFVLVDGGSGSVVGEGAASTWEQVTALLHNALDDAGLLDRKGRLKTGVQPRARGDAEREQRVDRDLLAAGIRPGDPSLYTLPEDTETQPSNDRSVGE
ncbi:MAG: hypothetical protein ABW033_06080 [Acidimicrobiia bacterium]